MGAVVYGMIRRRESEEDIIDLIRRESPRARQTIITYRRRNDKTLLWFALIAGYPKLMICLLQEGADPNCVAHDILYRKIEIVPLYRSIYFETVFTEILLAFGADPNHSVREKESILGICLDENYLDCVRVLLLSGARLHEDERRSVIVNDFYRTTSLFDILHYRQTLMDRIESYIASR